MAKTAALRTLFLWLVALVAVAYLAICTLLYAAQGAILYHPSPLLFEPDAQDITISGQTGTLHGWVVNPEKPEAVVYFGGNGEALEHDVAYYRDLLPGRSIYLVPYRGYGPNAGTPTERGIVADALAVFDFAQKEHTHIAVVGRSLGSGVATFVAARRRVDRIALITPYDSILNIARERYALLPISLLLRDRYESWRNAQQVRIPALILLASDDRIIPRHSSNTLIANLRGRKTIVVIPQSGHNSLSDSPLYASKLRDFLAPGQVEQAASIRRATSP